MKKLLQIDYSSLAYSNFIEGLKERNQEGNVESWFTKYIDDEGNISYHASIIKSEFNKWIKLGMAD